jgi:hypothetical protein
LGMAGGMKQVTARRVLIACVAVVLIGAVAAFWYAGATAPAIRVRFVSIAKHNFIGPGTCLATIQLENTLESPVVIRQVFVEECKSNRWMVPRPVSFSDPMAFGTMVSVPAFASLSTSHAESLRNPGQYRLHVSWFSDRNIPQGPAVALRYRLANLVFWLAPPWAQERSR